MSAEVTAAPPRRRGGAGWLLIATTAAGAVNYGYAVAMTHGLSPVDYTAFAAGQALLMLRATVSGAAISWVLARELSRTDDEDRRAVVVSFAFWSNLVLGAALTAAVVVGALLVGSAGDAVALGVASLLLSVGSTGMGYLQGTGRIGMMAVLLTAEAAIKAVVGAALVFGGHWQSAGALAGFTAGCLALLLPFADYRHLLRAPAWGSAQTTLVRAAFRQTRLQANVAIWSAADTVLVAAATTGGAAGPYQAASALGRIPLFASNAVSTAGFGALSADGTAARKAAALRSYLLVALVMVAGLVTLPGRVRALLFPASFAAIGQWLAWTAVLGLAVGLLNVVTTILQADDVGTGPAWGLTALTAGYLTAVGVAGVVFGVAGVAVAAVLASLVALLLLATWQSIRPAVRALLLSRQTATDAVLVALAFGGMVVARNAVAWLAVAVIAGLVVLARAFPDLTARLPSAR